MSFNNDFVCYNIGHAGSRVNPHFGRQPRQSLKMKWVVAAELKFCATEHILSQVEILFHFLVFFIISCICEI
jgi:hypothetical protein